MSRLSILLIVALLANPVAAQPKDPKPGEVRRFEIAKGVFMEFCWIPPGECQLGSCKEEQDYVTKNHYGGNRPDYLDNETESKRGKFKTKGFWLGKYTVTQAEWKAVMGDNPSWFDGKRDNDVKGIDTSRFPVESVRWDDCQKFLEKVNNRSGMEKVFGKPGKFVLPHEDQWEYACRGGKGNRQPFYWGDELNGTQANCSGENFPYGTETKGQSLRRTCAVDFTNDGKYQEHPWGLFHMSGNVEQWCDNLAEQTKSRVMRGSNWGEVAMFCRTATRNWAEPDYRSYFLGFRVSVSLEK